MTASTKRLQVVDMVRGVAIVLMVIFHFTYDLSHFGFVEVNFYRDPFWLNLRIVIVSLFLSLVGVSLVLATADGFARTKYLRRLALLVVFAGLITLSSFFLFPGREIFFGILHLIAFASLAGLAFTRRPLVSLLCGVVLIAFAVTYQNPLFNQPWLQWIGLMTHKPATEDYAPVLPWFGVVLIGVFVGHQLRAAPALQSVRAFDPQLPPVNALATLGRHSLAIYVLHQPILFGSVALAASLR